MGKLIITKGIPGCGKTTWTKQQLEANSDWVQVERDIIRLEIYGDTNKFSKEEEKEVSKLKEERILSNLKDGKVVISSDTNLNYKTVKHLESLAQQAKAEVEFKDFTNVSVEECIKRDALREKKVGADVIWKMYSKIRPDNEITTGKTHIAVGDCHGDYQQLTKLLASFKIVERSVWCGDHYRVYWSNPDNYFVVFLGDLNDPRLNDDDLNKKWMSSWECLRMAKSLCEAGIAEVLQSNHQQNLVNLYYGRRKSLSYGLEHTKQEMDSMISEAERDGSMVKECILSTISNTIAWLEARPYFYGFVEDGKKFYCSHAYYTESMSQYHPHGVAANDAIYGIKKEDKRYEWWLDKDYCSNDFIQICGHFHVAGFFPNKETPKAILVDGESGNTGGKLLAFIPSKMTIVDNKGNEI